MSEEAAPVEAPAAESSAPAPASTGGLIGGDAPAPTPIESAPVDNGLPSSQTPLEPIKSNEPWHNTLGEQYRDDPNISKYNSQEDFLQGHLNLVKKIGEKGIEMPDENATPEAWDAFYAKTGRPESIDGYSEFQQNITVDPATGEETGHFEFDQESLEFAKQKFFETGQSDKMVQANLQVYAEITKKAQDQYNQQVADERMHSERVLRDAYGHEFEHKMRAFTAVADSLGIKDDIAKAGLGNNLNVINMLGKLTEKIGESQLTGDVSPTGGGFESREAAIENHPGFRDKGHPEYNSLQKQRLELYSNKFNK